MPGARDEMTKLVALLKRRRDLSFNEFMDYYENQHVPLALDLVEGAVRYVRRYLRPISNPGSRTPLEPAFDAITELWFPNQEAFERTMARLTDPDVAPRIAADEGQFMERDEILTFMVDERESAIGP
jgi:uncharacterized protein (TIGR02118 family)